MELNSTPRAERLHIGFFGMRNAGKSSLVNALTGQSLSVVSDIKGTTTDPVKKSMELLPLGPVVIIDTPGLDDEGELGELRVKKALEALTATDIAVLVVDASEGLGETDLNLKKELQTRKIPFLVAFNKSDLCKKEALVDDNELYVSAKSGEGVEELKNRLGAFAKSLKNPNYVVRDLLSKNDVVVLVTPIDEAAPKGRLILPQQMVLRDILDAHATAVVCQDTELCETLASLAKKPRMVITDSQVFGKVAKDTPRDVPLTSFSILMARYKGDLATQVKGFSALKALRDGDRVLIAEGCTHHRQCNDIGTVKMPKWIEDFTKVKPTYRFTSGGEFPTDLSEYRVIVHCGGCMLNEAAMKHRVASAVAQAVPIVNYGIAIAGMHGILARSLELFPDILKLL
ncbi:MAG: [FeFe] hydrogenase H-cluster maturation GTPase HydF [Ruminococcaceae bacterium]|nr:[FeFe] hydrogenase H-cluster maturation GTPase HydF [Oscillospiraceae bacterium]